MQRFRIADGCFPPTASNKREQYLSNDALTWAFALRMTDASAKAVLIALANHADDEGKCWPSAERLELFTALADRTVRGALHRLSTMGAIALQIRPGRAAMCRLNLSWEGQPTPAASADVDPGRKCRTKKTTPAPDAGPPRQMLPHTPAGNADPPAAAADESSISLNETSVEPSTTTRGANGRSTARGTRLPANWLPDADDRTFAEDRGLNADVVGEEFRNFWVAVPGSKGLKLDWKATFRNRCIALAGTVRQPRASGHPIGINGGAFPARSGGVVAAAERVMRRRGLVS